MFYWWPGQYYRIQRWPCMRWVCAWRSRFLSLTVKSTPSTVILSRVSSILFKSVFEFSLPQAVIWRPSISPENVLWSGSCTKLSIPRRENALFDCLALSTLGITSFLWQSILLPVLWFRLLASRYPFHYARTVLTMFFWSVCISTAGQLSNLGWVNCAI